MSRVLDYNPESGIGLKFHYDHQTQKSIIEHVQDVEPILDWTAERAKHLNKQSDWWYVGTIPDSVVLQWSVECNAKPYSRKWRRYAAKQLNKPEYRKMNPNRLRVHEPD